MEEARAMLPRIEAAAPDAVVLPVLLVPTRSQRRAAQTEFGRYLALPTTLDRFLMAIEEAGRTR